MKLCYRGISYEYNPPVVETSDKPTVGKYRGLDWRFRNPAKNPVHQTTLDLKYRGVAYRTGETAAPAQPVAKPVTEPVKVPATSLDDRARALMMKGNLNIEKRQQAMLGRLVAEVGLDVDVSKYWNRIQGKVHPGFRTSYSRSASAMS